MMTDSRKSDTKCVGVCCDSPLNVDMSDICTMLLENRVGEVGSSINVRVNYSYYYYCYINAYSS